MIKNLSLKALAPPRRGFPAPVPGAMIKNLPLKARPLSCKERGESSLALWERVGVREKAVIVSQSG
ncbi:MAG: hypothetical protein GY721_11525 [Deltaproteobacteria bacterium]|nr:hypothetical protein [Deltaproteobacteria bacterium]